MSTPAAFDGVAKSLTSVFCCIFCHCDELLNRYWLFGIPYSDQIGDFGLPIHEVARALSLKLFALPSESNFFRGHERT